MIPLSLYIHIPWCEKKCPYCDFNSHLAKTDVNEILYIKVLLQDLEADLRAYRRCLLDRPIQSIFIGGGTPSIFGPESFSYLLNKIKQLVNLTDDVEVTIEANPGSSEASKFAEFRQTGINRLSIGVQSFNKQHLFELGRIHSSQDAVNAAQYAKSAGFDNFNIDLMFGLPKQSLQQGLADIRQAIELKPSHLSCYQLTIEPNTLFYHQPPITPDDDALWEMQTALHSELAVHNFNQYEVSAYAKQHRSCQHNINYWQYGDYLGIGAGAHGKITGHHGKVHRYWKIKHPNTYLEKPNKIGATKTVASEQLPFEFMLNALRLSDGFDLNLFETRTGLSTNRIQTILEKHHNLELIEIEDRFLTPTKRGKQMLNQLLEDYLP
ncbi:MAG: radical SAM family heme chaperone HemW [Acidiferrobacterales bacterium]|nr:radical SAM family heme chaperone HemW [Acidiferrobacterales bacterium]